MTRTQTNSYAFLGVALAIVATLLLLPGAAQADLCPSDNPVVQENNCSGAGSEGWRLTNYSPDVAGFSTKSSFNLGENVPLKIGRVNTSAASTVRLDVYRMGYYGNTGSRLITAASSASVSVNNLFSGCSATNATTGLKSCSGWATSFTIPGSSLPASGVYTAKLTTALGAREHDHLRRPRRLPQPQVRHPLRGPDRDLPGLQRLGRQVALLRQRRRQSDDLGHRARGQGLLRPAPQRPRPGQPLHRTRLLHGAVAREGGLRRLLHRRRLVYTRRRTELLGHKIDLVSPATASTGRWSR